MSPNYVNEFQYEKLWPSLSNFQLIILVVGFVEFFLFHILAYRKRFHALVRRFQPSKCQPQLVISCDDAKQEKTGDQSVTREEIDVVLRSLGMFSSSAAEPKLPLSLDADYLFELFEEERPSLEEVKEAFDVFDEDRDGFIVAEELQKVLGTLRLKEGSELENCRRMIADFDENGDGRIDFGEFVRFMESSLC